MNTSHMDGIIHSETYGAVTSNLPITHAVEPLPLVSCQYAPPFPAMPSTLVRLHILLQNRVVDLKSIVSVVRPDPGFAAEILRLTRNESQASSCSLHECLLDLGMENLRRAVRFIPSLGVPTADEERWQLRWRLRRARLTAMAAETISSALGDIPPEQAYLAGLLHDLPGLVCSNRDCLCKKPEILARLNPWNLPDYVVAVIRWHHKPSFAPAEHVATAHRVATARAWVDEIQLADACLPLGWFHTVSHKPVWHHLPNRGSVLRTLADNLEQWRFAL